LYGQHWEDVRAVLARTSIHCNVDSDRRVERSAPNPTTIGELPGGVGSAVNSDLDFGFDNVDDKEGH